jgi:hypothetical protein
MKNCLAIAALAVTVSAALPPSRYLVAAEFHVAPNGNDSNSGTADKPLQSIAAAKKAANSAKAQGPVTVLLHGGTYYLPETVVFSDADSGSREAPVVYAAAPGEQPILSGGQRLKLKWSAVGNGIYRAKLAGDAAVDQLFVNGQRQSMARYPNFGSNANPFNGSAADAIDPTRTARWADPAGGYIHAMHSALWGDMHWKILGKKPDGSLDYQGGWQNNRASAMHPQFRFVENIREELDAPGEWFYDARNGTLDFYPPANVSLDTATVEAVRLRHLIEFHGSKEKPVEFITLRGLTFQHAARTFMDNREPLLRSDWTVYRGGAVVCEGAADITIENCDFDQLGGNTIFINNYNRRITVRGCLLSDSGANGIAFVGNPKAVRSPLFNYEAKHDYASLDKTPGPIGDDFPADCIVDDCLIRRSGRYEKQTAPVQISMAQRIIVRHCSIYEVPRAGINIGDGCWGGHVIEHCDIFDTVLETGDHGSFNSWGRDRYWEPDVRLVDKHVAADNQLPFLDVVQPIHIRHNRWRCDHGWAVDLDDGSSRYRIYDNLMLCGGLKLREGYDRIATNNVIVNDSLHPHVWFENSGDVFARNIVMGEYRPAIMNVAKWGKEVDYNLFTTSEADRKKFADQGCDANSICGDPQFVDPAHGDFRVKDGSPALGLGFVNFPMDEFGVQSPRLRAVARVPKIPTVKITAEKVNSPAANVLEWRGAAVRDLQGSEFSAVGVAADAGGAFVIAVPPTSPAHASGLRKGDLIQQVNGRAVRTSRQFLEATSSVARDAKITLTVVRNQKAVTVEMN